MAIALAASLPQSAVWDGDAGDGSSSQPVLHMDRAAHDAFTWPVPMQLLPAAHANHPAAYGDYYWPCAWYPHEGGRTGAQHAPGLDFQDTPDGTYKIGDTINIRSDTGQGPKNPSAVYPHTRLALETGDVDRFAVYQRENGIQQVFYRYTVQPGDHSDDLDYRAPTGAEWGGAMHWGLPQGEYRSKNIEQHDDDEAVNCWLSTPGTNDYRGVGSLSAGHAVIVDGIIPRVENVTMASGAYGAGSQNVSVNFAEAVVAYGLPPSLVLALDGGNRTIPYLDGNETSSLVFSYAVEPNDLADGLEYAGTGALVPAAGGTLTDLAGNNASLALPEPGSPGSLGATSNVSITAASGEVDAVSSPLPNGAYPAGYRIEIAVNFTEPVAYSGAAPPSLVLNFSGSNRTASYASGNDTRSLVFEYTVQSGDPQVARLDYAEAGALQAGAGGLRDRAGDAVDTVLPWQSGAGQLGNSRSIAIDTESAAYVTGVGSPGGDSAYKLNDTVRIAVDFSVPVAVVGMPVLALATDPPRSASYAGGSGTRTLEFNYTVRQGDAAAGLDYAGVRALSLEGGASIRLDAQGGSGAANALLALPAPGGPGSLGHARDIAIDGAAPNVTSVASSSPEGTYGTGRIVSIAVAFDEPVFVEGEPALRLATVPPRSASYAGGSGTAELAFWYAVQPGDSAPRLGYAGEGALDLGGGASSIRDAAGNAANLTLPAPGSNRSLDASASIDVHGHEAPMIAAAGGRLGSATPNGVVAFELGGTMYAAVASAQYGAHPQNGQGGGGMQLFRVSDNGALGVAGVIRDDQGAQGLHDAYDIDALKVGDTVYVATASWSSHGVQLVLVDGSGALSAGARAQNGMNGFDMLYGSLGADIFAMNGTVYVLATSSHASNGGVQLIRVDGSSLERAYSLGEPNATALVQAGALPNSDTLALAGSWGVDVFEMAGGSGGASGNRTYAVVAAAGENAVQLVRVHENGTLAPADSLRRVNNTDLELRGARGIDAFKTAGNRTYAIVASHTDNGVQLVRVHENGTLGAAGWLRDTPSLTLEKPVGVSAFAMGNRTYAAVTSEIDDGVQLVRVHENGTLSAAGMVVKGGGFGLNTAAGIDVFAAGNHTYAIVTTHDRVGHINSGPVNNLRGAVQVIRLSPASVESVSTSLPDDGEYGEGHRFNVTVGFDLPVSVSDPPPSLMLQLGGGGIRLAAEYLDGDGTDSLVFNYTVGPGDEAAGALRHAGAGSMAMLGDVADARGKGPSNRLVMPPSMGDVVVDLFDPGRGPASADLDLPGSPTLLRSVVLDGAAPRVVGITEADPKGAAYVKDDTVEIAVTFHEPVVISAGASPSLRLALGGGATATAGFDRLSDGNRTLVFAYAVQDEDMADPLDYDGVGALSLPGGGTVADAVGNPADLSLPFDGGRGLLAAAGIEIDTEPPRVVSVSSPDRGSVYTADAKINITVSFDEAVDVTGAPMLALSTSPARSASYVADTDGDADLEFLYTVRPGDAANPLDYANRSALMLSGGSIRDKAGNGAVRDLPTRGGSDSLAASGIEIDAVAPEVVLPAKAEFRDRIRVTFDEPVSSGTANASAGWSISGPSAGRLSVADLGQIPPDEPLDNIVLVLDGHLPDTAPDIALSYNATLGGIADEAGNLLESRTGIDVADRIRPEFVEALITGPREVTIDYTEPVAASPSAYSDLDIGGVVRALEPHDTAALSQHVLGFSGAEAPIPEPPSTITIDGSAVLDEADPQNSLGDNASAVDIRDGRVLEVYSSRITDLDTAVITYTRNATAEREAYSSLVVAGQPRNITDLDGGGSGGHFHTITFSPGGAPPNATGSVVINGSAVASSSEQGMQLGDAAIPTDLADGQSPSARSAVAISLDTIRVSFDELVLDPGTGAAGWSVSGGDAAGIAVASSQDAAAPSNTLTLTLDSPLPDTAPDSITLSYHPAAGSVEDGAGNALVASSTAVADGIAPVVRSAVFSGPNEAEVRYTEPVWAASGAYESVALSSGGDPRPVTGLVEGNGTDLHTVSFGGNPVGLDATGMLEVDAAAIRDAAMLPLGEDGPIELGDTQPPSVSRATAVSLDTIRVVFDEPVLDPGTGAGGWSVSGGDAAGIAVASSQDAAVPSATLTLALNGPLPDTAPDGVLLVYDPAAGSIEDRAGNALAASSTAVADGIAPSIASAFVGGPNGAEIRYTEPVWAASGAYASISLSSGGDPRPVEGLEGNGTAVHTLSFGGEPVGQGTIGTLAMDATGVRDAAMLPIGSDAMFSLSLADEAPPPVRPGEATARAVFATRNTVAITYSAPLGPPAGHSGLVYTEVAIDGQGGSGARPVSGVQGLGTAMHTVAFGGAGVNGSQTGTITLAVGLEGAGEGDDRPRFAAGAIPVASGRTIQTVLLSQPQQGSQMPVRIEPDGFTRTVDGTAAGSSARLAINVTGLVQSSDDPGTAVFPAEAVTLAASFARVTFPPGVTATSVPAGGAISLYVDAVPAENATSALGYPAAGTLTLRTVVEVGGSQAPVLFDMPVRISLEGQAGGRAFYIEGGADGVAKPIDLACAADDTERVHRQLGGMGECRIESGDDLVIHTYHLTRFGTAASDRGTPPPVVHTCSMRLAVADLAVGASAGAYSKAVRQAVVNSGSQPFARVALDATPWYIDPVSDTPGTDAPSLPASLTVSSGMAQGGQFAPLPGAVADGLGGGQEEPLWLAINLTGHAQVNGTRLVQDVAYTAECGGPPG